MTVSLLSGDDIFLRKLHCHCLSLFASRTLCVKYFLSLLLLHLRDCSINFKQLMYLAI